MRSARLGNSVPRPPAALAGDLPPARATPGRRGQARETRLFGGVLGVALIPFLVSALTVLVAGRDYHAFQDNALTELNVRDVGYHAVEVGVFNR